MLDLETQAKEAIAELFATGKVKPGSVVVIGCSTSEIAGKHIGKGSVPEIAGRIVGVLMEEIAAHGCYLAAQCCEHLNRALHMCDVAVPLRLEHNKIGEAAVNAAYSRPKLIGGVRADYPD